MAKEIVSRQEGAVAPAAESNEATSLLGIIARAASDPAVDVEKMAALLGLQERVVARQAEAEFNQAFIRMQAALPRIKKDGTLEYPVDKNKPDGPKRKIASFAKWETIDAAIRPILETEGFALSFNTIPRPGDGGGLIVTAILRHRGGHSTETSIPVPLDTSGGKNNLQGYGSSMSYGKRYAATAALNLITEGEDDDGVRGGMRFISQDQVAELTAKLKDAGREEGPFLDRLFGGTVRSFGEIEVGNGFHAAMSALDAIIRQKQHKGSA